VFLAISNKKEIADKQEKRRDK